MCYYKFDSQNHALHNFYAINSKEGIAPIGFCLPREEDELEKIISKVNLHTGLLQVGRDAMTAHNQKKFADITCFWQAADQDCVEGWDEIVDGKMDEDMPIGGLAFEVDNENKLESINQNGWFRFPILLIPIKKRINT